VLALGRVGGTALTILDARSGASALELTLDQLAETQRRASAWTPTVSRSVGPLSARY